MQKTILTATLAALLLAPIAVYAADPGTSSSGATGSSSMSKCANISDPAAKQACLQQESGSSGQTK